MDKKILKGMFYFFSAGMLYFMCKTIVDKNVGATLIALLFVLILNPFILGNVVKKIGGNEKDFYYVLKIMFSAFGLVLAWIISIQFLRILGGTESEITERYEAIFATCVYVVYVLVLLVCKSENKFFNYIVFGVIYLIFIIFRFLNGLFYEGIVDFINIFPFTDLTEEQIGILIDKFLDPIKEAILTYIIFDTAISEKKNEKEKKNDDEKEIENGSEEESKIDKVESDKSISVGKREYVYNVCAHDNSNGVEKEYIVRINR